MACRDKNSPLSYPQRLFLAQQIRDNPVIYKKASDYRTVLAKKAAWENITENFNLKFSMSEVKTQQQLKRNWEYLRNKVKKEHGPYLRKTHQTGEGPPPTPPKPIDELTLIIQHIFSNDLPQPSDILDSESVKSYLPTVEFEAVPTDGLSVGQPQELHTLVDNPGSPIVLSFSTEHAPSPIESEHSEEQDQPQTLQERPGSPSVISGTAARETTGQDTGHLPSTSSTPKLSFRGQKREAEESKSASYKKCSEMQSEFRRNLNSELKTLIKETGTALAKVENAAERIASAADAVGSAADRIASAAERVAAALEKITDNL